MKIKIFTYVLISFLFFESCKSLRIKNEPIKTEKDISKNSSFSCTIPYFKSGQIVSHSYYNLQYAEEHEQAYWVSYKLTPNFLIKNATRKNNFKPDSKITTGSATLGDYKGSGFDRGHLAPAGSMVFNQKAMDESFYMSNMSPQNPSFNRGVWKRLESKVRYWAKNCDSLFVATGPVLKDLKKTIGENKVSVPNSYYKVLVRFDNKGIDGIAFLLKNTASKEPLNTFAVPIDSIEAITNIDFNSEWDTPIQNKIEKEIELSNWLFD